jgi:hypothetical protein
MFVLLAKPVKFTLNFKNLKQYYFKPYNFQKPNKVHFYIEIDKAGLIFIFQSFSDSTQTNRCYS